MICWRISLKTSFFCRPVYKRSQMTYSIAHKIAVGFKSFLMVKMCVCSCCQITAKLGINIIMKGKTLIWGETKSISKWLPELFPIYLLFFSHSSIHVGSCKEYVIFKNAVYEAIWLSFFQKIVLLWI